MSDHSFPPETRWREQWGSALLWCVALMMIILIGWAFRAAAVIVVPIVFSIFLALLVAPVDRWVTERASGRFRWLGPLAAMGAIVAALLIFVTAIWLAAQQVVERFPTGSVGAATILPPFGSEGSVPSEAAPGSPVPPGRSPTSAEAVAAESRDAEAGSGGILSRLGRPFGSAGGALTSRFAEWASGYATTILSAAGTMLAGAVLVFFLTLLMLIEAPDWRTKLTNLARGPSRLDAMESVQVIGDRLRRYLWARTMLGLLTAFLHVTWLWMFGVDLLIVWGLLAFLFNYVPTVGSLIAGVLPVLYAFVQKDFGTAAAIGAGILLIEQVMGNYVDPRVQGRQVSLSPLVVLIALLFWGWIWGIAGAILAVPVTIVVAIIAAHIGPLRSVALLLSNRTDMEGLDEMATKRAG